MLTVWGRKTSSNVQAVMWLIGELELRPYQRIDAGHNHGGLDTETFLALNPNGLVPVVIDGDSPPLWETGAILRYLANRYAPDAFWPRDPVRNAQVDKWAEWAKVNSARRFTVPVFWRVARTRPADRDPAAIAAALEELGRILAIAERQLGDVPFIAGDTFTLADIMFGHILYRYFDIPIERPSLPHLRAYYDRLVERPAYREHVMVSYASLCPP